MGGALGAGWVLTGVIAIMGRKPVARAHYGSVKYGVFRRRVVHEKT